MRARITEIRGDDPYYPDRYTIIGREGSILNPEGIASYGWISMTFLFDEPIFLLSSRKYVDELSLSRCKYIIV